MSNGTIENNPPFNIGRVGVTPGPPLAAYIYAPTQPSGLVPPLTLPPGIENYPPMATNGVAIAPDGGVWQYAPTQPGGMTEIIPALVPPSNVTAPAISWVGGTPNTVGATAACNAGSWTPAQPTPTYTRLWYSGGAPIPSATGVSYVIQATDVGNMVFCLVTATNPAGAGIPAQSNSVGPIVEPAEEARFDDNGGAQSRSVNETPTQATPRKRR